MVLSHTGYTLRGVTRGMLGIRPYSLIMLLMSLPKMQDTLDVLVLPAFQVTSNPARNVLLEFCLD